MISLAWTRVTELQHLVVPADQTWLQLDNYSVSALSDDLTRFTQITELRCGANQLTEIPACVFVLTQLAELALHHNAFRSVPRDIGRMALLVELHLNGNQLASVPAEIGNLCKLRWLLVSRTLGGPGLACLTPAPRTAQRQCVDECACHPRSAAGAV